MRRPGYLTYGDAPQPRKKVMYAKIDAAPEAPLPPGIDQPTPELVEVFRLINQKAPKRAVNAALNMALAQEKVKALAGGRRFSQEFLHAIRNAVKKYEMTAKD